MLTAAPALAGVGLVANQGEPLRIVELPGPPGLLTSTSTRIPGLIATDDLQHRERLGVLSVPDPRGQAERLQRRFEQLHGARRWAHVLLAALTIAAILGALLLRTEFTGRLCIAIAPALLTVSLLLSLGGAARPGVILPVLGAGSVALAAAVAAPRRLVAYFGAALLLLFLVVLWARPQTIGFAVLGTTPEQGGRFFGINNLLETVLLTSSLFSAYALGFRAVLPVAVLALVTVGWSRTGADGGGLVVYAAAFAVLALRMAGRVTWKRIGLAALAAVALALAFIGADEVSGGHSHVTKAFEKGPAGWFGDLGHRLHLSADELTRWHVALIVALSVAALLWLALRRPRVEVLDALLVGLAVSLLLNDTPGDVAPAGAISGFVLWAWATTRYTRARAPAGTDPGRGRPPGGRLRRRGNGKAAPRHGDRDGPDSADREG